jgi:hypothetical protein
MTNVWPQCCLFIVKRLINRLRDFACFPVLSVKK